MTTWNDQFEMKLPAKKIIVILRYSAITNMCVQVCTTSVTPTVPLVKTLASFYTPRSEFHVNTSIILTFYQYPLWCSF